MYHLKYSTIFGSYTPFLYSLIKIPLKLLYPNSNDKLNHVGIMTIIGAIKGVTIDYNPSQGYLQSSTNEGCKSFVKFAVSAICIHNIKPYEYHTSSSKLSVKPICSAVGALTSSIYSKGLTDLPISIYKAIATGITNSIAEPIRKSLIIAETHNMGNLNLWGLISSEVMALPSNIGHSITLGLGKEVSSYLLSPNAKEIPNSSPEDDTYFTNKVANYCVSPLDEQSSNSTPYVDHYFEIMIHCPNAYSSANVE